MSNVIERAVLVLGLLGFTAIVGTLIGQSTAHADPAVSAALAAHDAVTAKDGYEKAYSGTVDCGNDAGVTLAVAHLRGARALVIEEDDDGGVYVYGPYDDDGDGVADNHLEGVLLEDGDPAYAWPVPPGALECRGASRNIQIKVQGVR